MRVQESPSAVSEPRGVELRGIGKSFGRVVALSPLDLVVRPGELLVLLGPSGCGKSTLLKIIAGLEEPSVGELLIGGENVDDVPPRDRDVAMVFQGYALYPHMTVERNLGFGLMVRGVRKAERAQRVRAAAEQLGLAALLDRRPGELSGGQQQRVALGRALVRNPSIFLFDEPLSNLDARLRLRTRDEIANLHQKLGTTMLFVTHDQTEAMSLGQRIAVLNEGRLQQVGEPTEIYEQPSNLFVARFLGTPPINLVPLSLLGQRSQDSSANFARRGLWPAGMEVPEGAPPGGTLGVRPEDLRIVDPDGRPDFRAEIVRVEALGSESRVHITGPGESSGANTGHWIVRTPPAQGLGPGDEVGVALDWPRAHLFDSYGVRIGSATGGASRGPGV